MSLGTSLAAPYFTGASVNVDERWDVSLGGHGYMIDTMQLAQFGRQTISMIRQQADTAGKPAEQSLNPEGLWRRAVESWHLGAGQTWFDRPESNPYRFNTSKGVDPWTRYGLSLLPATASISSSANTNLALAAAGGALYIADGSTVKYTGVGGLTTSLSTGLPLVTVTSLTSSGSSVYAGMTARGVWVGTAGAFTQIVTGTGTYPLVRYVMGRLVVADNTGNVYNIIATGAPPTPLFTHPLGSAWTWTDATEGKSFIYLSGYAGDRSMIYRLGIGTDATALDVPVVAAPLPDGEIAMSLQGYLGYVVIGTNKGVRFAEQAADGSLQIGSLIPTASTVLCAEGQDHFVWYGLTNYDGTSTGLGRLDLQNFTDNDTPAYASDLMVTGQGAVTSVATYLNKRVIAVSGLGIYMEQSTKVASGSITSGRITFDLPDTKTAVQVQVRHDPLPAAAEVDLSLSLDSGTSTVIGKSELDGTSVSAPDAFTLNQARAAYYELTTTLLGDLTLRRITLEVDPSSTRTVVYQVPLLLHHTVMLPGEVPADVDVESEFAFLLALLQDRSVVNYQEGSDTYRVVLDDFTWQPEQRSNDFWDGTFIARLKGL